MVTLGLFQLEELEVTLLESENLNIGFIRFPKRPFLKEIIFKVHASSGLYETINHFFDSKGNAVVKFVSDDRPVLLVKVYNLKVAWSEEQSGEYIPSGMCAVYFHLQEVQGRRTNYIEETE